MNIRARIGVLTAAALLVLAVQPAMAAEVVGYNRISIPANADVRLSAPFNQTIEGTYTVTSVAGSVISVAETITDTYNGSYYIRFISGSRSGLWATIASNTASDITLANSTVLTYGTPTLPTVAPGDILRVYKHHTLSSLFPPEMYDRSYTNLTAVLIYPNDVNVKGINKAASKTAVYAAALGRWTGAGITNNTILEPEGQFILRNGSSKKLEMITQGYVPDHAVSMLIDDSSDLYMGTGYPLPIVLNEAGLEGTLRAVLFYDNTAPGINKAAVKTAVYTPTGGGRWTGAGVTGNELITPSETVTFRLHSSEAGNIVTINKPY